MKLITIAITTCAAYYAAIQISKTQGFGWLIIMILIVNLLQNLTLMAEHKVNRLSDIDDQNTP